SFTDLHGVDYLRCREVSAEIHSTTVADGILYTSRFDNHRCVALFDRAANAIAETATKAIVIGAAQATALAHHFGKMFVEP
ncbi:MAG: RES domain-containing protein, partial [Aliihoeflea sp.]|uniref:RES domain-containing protein n=1 Tax=Aliihoeflea sp. TaxID=2608088 RepID=UPI0040347292